jgi:hypothetical protein
MQLITFFLASITGIFHEQLVVYQKWTVVCLISFIIFYESTDDKSLVWLNSQSLKFFSQMWLLYLGGKWLYMILWYFHQSCGLIRFMYLSIEGIFLSTKKKENTEELQWVSNSFIHCLGPGVLKELSNPA